jgi:hypothetical protein
MTPSSPVTLSSTTWNHFTGNGMWLSAANPSTSDRWVLFTFANNTSLDEMVIWNYNQNYNPTVPNLWLRGLKGVTITCSTGSDATGLGTSLFSGDLAHATGSATQGYTDQLTFGNGVLDVKAVRIAYTSNWDSGSYYGLSEVRFAAIVPEPGTLLLLATALPAGLVFWWRRRNRGPMPGTCER